VTSGFETSEALVGIGGGQAVTAAVEEGFGEVRLCTKGMYGGVEVPNLVLVLAVAGDIGSKTPISKFFGGVAEMGIVGGTPLEEAEKPGSQGLVRGFGMFGWTRKEFVGIGWLLGSETTRDTPDLLSVVFVSFDEFGWEVEPLSNGDLKRRDAVIVADEVGGDAGFVEVEILIFVSFHGSLQAVLGVVNASAHSCVVSFPGEFAELDGGDETCDDLSEAFGGYFVMGGQGGEDGIRRHGSVVVKDGG